MEGAQAAARRIAEDTKALESELRQMRAAEVPEPLMTLSEAERERLREP